VLGAQEGWIVLSAGHSRGFTIVELLVGITLVGILLGLGAPSMATYLQNSKLASAAASYFNGVQLARTEAIRRNVRTEFVLTDTPVSASDPANSAALLSSGKNWIVRAASGASFTLVEAKAGAEGDGGATSAAIQVAGSAATIPFNGFGATANGAGYTINISNPAAGTCVQLGGTIRCRRITVSPGGQVAACDPAASAALGDSRAC
jgi:type IV fimbrial biogenesis protein FimT